MGHISIEGEQKVKQVMTDGEDLHVSIFLCISFVVRYWPLLKDPCSIIIEAYIEYDAALLVMQLSYH